MKRISTEAALLICGPISVALVSGCTLFRFAEKGPNCVSFLTAVLGVTLSFSIVAVVPYDVWHALATEAGVSSPDDVAPSLPESLSAAASAVVATAAGVSSDEEWGETQAAQLLRRSWSALYWTTAVLCYIFFPFLMEFEASGDFCTKARIATSVRRNIVFYMVYIVVGSVVLVWLIVSGEVQGDLESWCIAASNAWGLLVLTVLMGFGLVGVPRHLWRLACPKEQLQRLYISAVTKDELRLSRLFELQDAMEQVRTELSSCSQIEDRETTRAFAKLTSTLERCGAMHAVLSRGGRCDSGDHHHILRNGRHGAVPIVGSCTELHPAGANGVSGARARANGGIGGGGRGAAEEGGEEDVDTEGEGAEGGEALVAPTPSTTVSSSSSPSRSGRRRGDLDVELGSGARIAGANGGSGAAASGSSVGRLLRWAKLHGSLKVASLEARRAASQWESHVNRCMFFEDLDGGHFKAAAELLAGRPNIGFPRGTRSHVKAFAWRCGSLLLVFWLRHLRSRFLRLLSYCCGTLSALIVLGQMTMFDEGQGWRWSALAYVFREDHGPMLTQTLCVIPLSYMTYTAYFSIFRLRVPGWYGLYGNHSTDMGSLLWCASILARLAAPMCYHFLLLIRVRGTTFQNFMGKMNVVPVLGESFNDVFPCIIALLCLFNLLNIYSRIVRCLSLGTVDFELAAGAGGEDPLSEGRLLMERERRRRTEEAATELPARERLAVPLAQGSGCGPGER